MEAWGLGHNLFLLISRNTNGRNERDLGQKSRLKSEDETLCNVEFSLYLVDDGESFGKNKVFVVFQQEPIRYPFWNAYSKMGCRGLLGSKKCIAGVGGGGFRCIRGSAFNFGLYNYQLHDSINFFLLLCCLVT